MCLSLRIIAVLQRLQAKVFQIKLRAARLEKHSKRRMVKWLYNQGQVKK